MRARLAAALAAGLALASQARADTQTIAGSQLVLTDTLSDAVIISTDAALSGHVRVSLDGPLSCLTIVSGATVVISTSRCGEDTGRLRIDVSPDTPVTISSSSEEAVHVGDLRAPLVASMNGSGDLMAGHTGGLALSLRGHADVYAGEVDGPTSVDIGASNDVRIKQVRGPFTVRQVSSGDLIVGGIDSDSVAIESSGSGDMLFGPGRIGSLHARVLGHGDLAVAASMRDADVEARGGGDVRLAPVSGALIRNASGGSTITVGGSDLINSLTGEAARRITSRAAAGDSSSASGHSQIHLHMLTAAFLVLVAFIAWRIVRRSGGLRRPAPTAPATNPAVLALSATLARLDQRLGRVEEYVTTKEFDLNRKFREL